MRSGPVLFICSELTLGGAERHWGTLLPALRSRGRPLRLVALKGGGAIFDRLASEGIATRNLEARGGIATALRLPAVLAERTHRPSAVFSWGYDAAALGAALSIVDRIPHYVHWHAGPGSRISRQQRLAFRLAARAGATAVAVARAQEPELRGFGFATEQIAVAPPGVPVPSTTVATRAEARAALGLPAASFMPTVVARIAPEKRLERFVAAVEALERRGHEVLGVVVGDGRGRNELERHAQERRAPVRFVGMQERPGDFMIAADVVCLTSQREAMPLSLLEAAACGRPAVAMDVGGVAEVVEDGVTGAVVGNGDVEAFADALERLAIAPDTAAALGAQARERWESRYSLEGMIAWYARLLTSGARR